MDTTEENLKPNPREGANFLSTLFFTYTFGMFWKGFKKSMEVQDLYKPINDDKSQWLGDRLERKWVTHLEGLKRSHKKPSFLKTLLSTFWPEYILLGVILFVMEVVVRIAQPLMLGKLLEYFHPKSTTTESEAYWYAGSIVILNAVSVLLVNQYLMGAFHYGMRVRAACCALIYRKALRLSRTAMVDTAAGKIVNLLSNDVSRFDLVSILLHYMWVSPISALVVMFFLWNEAGYAGIIGVVPMLVVVPLQSYTGKLAAIYRKGIAQKTDERVRLMDEIISGIQVIKMYAWEKPFQKVIYFARKAELKVVAKSSYVRGLYMTFNLFTTRVALFCALLTMALSDQEITAAKVFVFMSFLNVLGQSLTSMFVRGVSELSEVLVSINRIQQFMTNDEFVQLQRPQHNNKLDNETSKADGNILSMKNVSAKWNINQTDNALTGIDLNIASSQLVGIIGPVAAGKSSFLQTILGELNVVGGTIDVNGTISYASQDAWVFAASVRQNILFGQSYDKKRYRQVIGACALEQDFAQFAEGDLTIVGDRGASLSGGQKARINLARAVYRDADIYLLDDPLSAVDIHVGKHLYDQCINGYLRNKIRILVTHQVYHLKNADEIIILNNGVIEDRGTFQKLTDSTSTYAHLLTAEPEEPPAEEEIKLSKSVSKVAILRAKSISEGSKLSAESNGVIKEKGDGRALQEESSENKVKGNLFFKYLYIGGNKFLELFVVLLYVLAQVAASGVDYFVSYWTNIEEHRNEDALINHGNLTARAAGGSDPLPPPPTDSAWSRETCINIYGGLVAALFIIALSRSMLFYKLAIVCSQKLHDKLFDWVINASMRFYDTHPSGQILNRFAKDMGCVDELLPKAILDAGQSILILVGALLLVGVVSPYFLILVGVISIVFYLLRVVFLRTSMPLKRLEGMMRSPVFTHLNATLQGLTTIRAFQCQEILTKDFDKHQDYHTGAWFMYIIASASFAFYLDLVVFFMIALVTFSFLAFGEALGLQGGQIGLAITQCATLTGLIQWGMRQSADVSNQLMSVERILEYEQIEKEVQPAKPKTPPKDWPAQGKITFKDMGLKYDEDGALVLRDINITILPMEKIGIVGRTGAGKSSIISALFRLANVQGEINIDGINTEDIVLQLLRSKISIIPQDPVLFSGTLRYNLDPFGEYSDDLLYQALEEVELKDPNNIFNRLENKVNEKGSNYSVGQRQLICLARAIVRRNKILMLDEATANVDPQTDELIQKTIRTKFAECTVLTVAHRLNTIMDSDKILVMEYGKLMEYDHPHILLQNKEGKLSSMVNETGAAMEDKLKSIAKENYEKISTSHL